MGKTIQITRYRVETNDLYDMEESPNGSWVYWDDVEPLIKNAEAAPDLYEALQEMTLLAEGPTGGVSVSQKKAIVAKARAALSKATA